MSKVLPIAVHNRPELNLRQGIKSSLNHWRQLIASLYLFYGYLLDDGDAIYSKEIRVGGKVGLEVSDGFANWLSQKWSRVANVKTLVQQCPLYTAQMEHLQVGLQLFLKLAQVRFADTSLPDATERTGGNRFNKLLHFSTNMKILADAISAHSESDRITFVADWLSGIDDTSISNGAKEILAAFTEECQFKIRTASREVFFQQDGIYDRLRNMQDSVESTDASEPVGPFRILKSYVKEEMHPYLSDGANGFVIKSSSAAFTKYADMVRTTLSLIPKRTMIYQEIAPLEQHNPPASANESLQQITYGAPGTGKSWGVENEIRDAHGKGTIRTTFHPDSDYSTFVGTYKPAMRDYGADEKTEVYRIVKASGGEVKTLEGERVQKGRRVAYEFVPQAFLEAYVAAWRKCAAFLSAQDDAARGAAIQFLVIEEINRGDCAKIFGDLFQLLDRADDGYSTYAVKPDTDIRLYLNEVFAGNAAKGVAPIDLSGVNFGGRDMTAAEIASGEKMLLPPNMYIRATMNTSDQSLFPMDSAFKRRWDWKYVPICNHAEKAWTIAVDSSLKYEWWDFLEKINKQVFMLTNSEDKQLGYFFVRAKGDEVSLDMFVNKVVFYLWNVVFKDCFSECDFLKSKDGNDHLLFTGFFNDDGTPKKQAVVTFLDALKVKKFSASGDGQGAQQQSIGDGQASDNGGTAAAS